MVVLVVAAWGGLGRGDVSAQRATLTWRGCGGGFDCATLAVPLDHGAPGGRHIEVALIRRPAREANRRLGVMLVNPGGPGGSGVFFVRNWSHALGGEVRDRFDIIGFDPRGVGQSTPLLCHDNVQQIAGLEPAPRTADEWAEVERVLRDFGALCASRGGEMLPHLGSVNVVRDMDRIREALGEERINYLGFSYGTLLGAIYADRYPTRVRAMVLDGPIDITATGDGLARTQALGFEDALRRFGDDCRATSCILARDGRDPIAAIEELVERSRARPIPARLADRPARVGEVFIGVAGALYNRATWGGLARGVHDALEGDATTMIRFADRYLGRVGEEYDNSNELNAAVNCVDRAYSRDPAHYRALADRFEEEAPFFGRALAIGGLTCAFWQAPASPVGELRAQGAPPLLVIGTTHDPATPFTGALAMRRQLASAVLLTHEGDGHTIYASGNRCVDSTVERYLLEGALSVDGAICGSNDGGPRTPPTPPAPAATGGGALDPVVTPPPAQEELAPAALPILGGLVALLVVVTTVGVLRWRRRRGPLEGSR